ncbi:MAG TPA: undecaprenyldiphospho-muramoylpentapeptide beta-N-acetylglucosaminyltransferase, partial [Rhodospirillales bacterium]|nr:undecaprenyldiphospho-muramoylpentapeptide beta-N-acetylglucosaminyltransferase [Rhodospirillales bacterium]
MSAARVRVVLAAGGTGGHVFPAEALAAQLRERGIEPVLFTDRRGVSFGGEMQVRRIRGGGIAGQSAMGRLKSMAELGAGLAQAGWALRTLAPRAVVGFGSYASVPSVMAASLLGIPTIIHEQNALLGRANRLLARRADKIATAFGSVAALPKGAEHKLVRTGMPVRSAFARLRDRSYQPPEPSGPIRLLVLGGSQGARIFGEVVPAAIDRLNARVRSRLVIVQQCRPEALSSVEDAYRRIGIGAELSSFFDDVPARLAATHLLIARAGASTIAEITALGCPAVLVPYPYATDDHQTANARAVTEAGGAWLMPQDTLTPEGLAARLEELFAAPPKLAAAAAAARAAGFDRAAARLADLVLEVIGAAPPET